MERDNEFFYVFLNIKGALYTKDWIKFIQASILEQDDVSYSEIVKKMLSIHPNWSKFYHAKGYNKSKHIRKICPYNIDALNRLLDDLKLDYNVNLVITTQKWKEMFDLKTIPALVKNGLNYKDLIIDKTNIKEEKTSNAIKAYLKQVGNPSNYIIIDYEEDVINKFDREKVIIVDQFKNGLTNELVDNYLDGEIIEETGNYDYNFMTDELLQNV